MIIVLLNHSFHSFHSIPCSLHSTPRPSSLTVAGGATKSDLWLQIHADVSNLPLHLTE